MVLKNKENNELEAQLHPEIIKSERMRVTLLAIISMATVLVFIFYIMFFSNDIKAKIPNLVPVYIIILVFLMFFIRELVVRNLLKKREQDKKKIKKYSQYINTFIESSYPTILLALGVSYWNNSTSLYSPAVLLYFFVIILSTLSLDFGISLFTGAVCALEYLAVTIYSNLYLEEITSTSIVNSAYFQFGKIFILFMSGVLAGIVALQLRRRITLSFRIQSERNKIINLFGQQVSPEIVTELITQKESIETKNKYVCIMFLDIREFTPFAEKLTPKELNEYQNKVFGYMIEIIAENYGVINQFLGDGYMATFGAPVSKSNDSQNALNAAIEIINKTNKFSEDGEIPKTKVGIGLHAGYVVAGNVGTAIRKQYSITGNTVILSSRIEQLNKEYDSQLLVSEEVINAVNIDRLEKRPINLGEVKVKGREKPINLYKIL